MRHHVLEELAACSHSSDEAPERFSAVLGQFGDDATVETRWDLRLRLRAPVRRALCEALRGSLGDALSEAVGNDAELWELAALVAAPGAGPQPLHADTLWDADGCLYTAFIALQKIPSALGPTRFLRGSHTEASHAAFDEGREDGSFVAAHAQSSAAKGLLGTGEATLYDGRLLHAGSANTWTPQGRDGADGDDDGGDGDDNAGMRALFYITFRRARARADALANDDAHSICDEYRGRFSLGRLRGVARAS